MKKAISKITENQSGCLVKTLKKEKFLKNDPSNALIFGGR